MDSYHAGRRQLQPRLGLRGEFLEDRRLLTWGPELVVDLDQSPASSVEGPWLTSIGDSVYVAGPDPGGSALWRIPADGQNPVKLAVTSVQSLGFRVLQSVGERVVFSMNYLGATTELWTTDGTLAGTNRLGDFSIYVPVGGTGRNTTNVLFEGDLYFWGTGDNSTDGLWRTDGTLEGTELVTAGGTFESTFFVSTFRGRLYFGSGNSLYSTDGTPEGALSVANPFLAEAFAHRALAIENSLVYTTYEIGQTPDTWHVLLWETDGTAAGTGVRKQFPDNQAAGLLGVVDGSLFYSVWEDDGGRKWLGEQSWATTQGGLIKEFPPTEGFTATSGFANFHGTAFFVAADELGMELWRSDGTEQGTVRVADINPGAGWGVSGRQADITLPGHGFAFLGGTLFFAANDGVHGYELWKLAPLPGDTNYDGRVDLSDFGLVKANLGRTGANLPGELDYDGDVDLDDFGILKANFGVAGDATFAAPRAPLPVQPQADQNAAVDQALAALGLAWHAASDREEEQP